MNINTVNNLFGSGIAVTYQPVQLPNISVLNNISLVCHSGSTNSIYIGSSGVTDLIGWPLAVNAGISLAVDNANRVWAVMQSGYTGQLRYVLS